MAGKVEIKQLIGRLNKCCRLSMEKVPNLCVLKGHEEMTIEHFLYCLLEYKQTDFALLLKQQRIEPDQLKIDIEKCFRRMRPNERGTNPDFSPMLIELFQDAWLIASVELGHTHIRSGSILIALVRGAGRYVNYEYAQTIERLSPNIMLRNYDGHTAGSVETEQAAQPQQAQDGKAAQDGELSESALARYAIDFTQLARDGEIDPVFCRDDEIVQMTEVLGRRRKNNPICVGEAGVGKTAVAEGLALKIVEEDVPDYLIGVQLWGLDMGALQAGASVKGEFEKRLKGVIEEVKNSETPIILFIDEAHTLIGAGGQAGGGDAANLLKPALARGELKTIAATTWSEYKKYFEKDPALARRFQLIKLDEPTTDQAITIMRGLTKAYEKNHGVYISDEAIAAAVKLSARYITGRQLPDKAIDVLDTACARVKVSLTSVPSKIEKLERAQAAILREKTSLERDLSIGLDDKDVVKRIEELNKELEDGGKEIDRLTELFSKQKELVQTLCSKRDEIIQSSEDDEDFSEEKLDDIIELEQAAGFTTIQRLRTELKELCQDETLITAEVSPEVVGDVIADWTGIPVSSMAQDDYEKLLNLSERMGKTIKGQDHALKAIETRLRTSRLDLHKKGQPLGVFLLVGSSGIGKTETALEVARQMFGSEQFITTINMSEYQEQHTISRLIGSPPGYVGYGEGGILTEAIRKKPYSVVLLDEVEKADVNVLNLFYQAFDKGELADGEGRLIDCKNCIFFLTSNLGSEQIVQWVETAEEGKVPTPELMLRSLQPVFANHFKPALLARMHPIVYMPLDENVLGEIVEAKIAELRENLEANQGVKLTISPEAIDQIKTQCGRTPNGARLIDQVLQNQLLPTISLEILESGMAGTTLTGADISLTDDKGFAFAFTTLETEKAEENAA